jgi:hypothetical protein
VLLSGPQGNVASIDYHPTRWLPQGLHSCTREVQIRGRRKNESEKVTAVCKESEKRGGVDFDETQLDQLIQRPHQNLIPTGKRFVSA